MKIKGVIEGLKLKTNLKKILKNDNSKNISRKDFFWCCCGQCGVSSFSDSSLIWLILL